MSRAVVRPLRSFARACASSSAEWRLCSDGLTRWRTLRAAAASAAGTEVERGQVVRVRWAVSAEADGGIPIVPRTQSSFRAGHGSSSVCAALDLGVVGMRLGETRQFRAPPQARRGHLLEGAPREILQYDATLTGVVQHMQIRTLEQEQASDDPLQMAVDAGKRGWDRLITLVKALK
jgi:hypothetical protein